MNAEVATWIALTECPCCKCLLSTIRRRRASWWNGDPQLKLVVGETSSHIWSVKWSFMVERPLTWRYEANQSTCPWYWWIVLWWTCHQTLLSGSLRNQITSQFTNGGQRSFSRPVGYESIHKQWLRKHAWWTRFNKILWKISTRFSNTIYMPNDYLHTFVTHNPPDIGELHDISE